MLLIKNPQFFPNHYETWPPWPTHELLILTKFHNDWVKIVDFLIIAYFRACVIFYNSVFKCLISKYPKRKLLKEKTVKRKWLEPIVFRQICADRSFENLFGIKLTVKDVVSVFLRWHHLGMTSLNEKFKRQITGN